MTMFTFTIAIDDKTLFWRIENYHAQETSSLTTLLLLVLQKTRVSVFLVEMKCGQESFRDIRQDCCHHFVSEREFGRNAQRVCQAERTLMSPLARTKQAAYVLS